MTLAPDAAVDLLLARPLRPLDGLAPPDWQLLLEIAHRHGLLGAVAGRLPAEATVRTRFDRLAAAVRLRDEALRSALGAVVRVLDAGGIPVAALKGPVLADRVHPDPGLRPSSDLDLLVDPTRLAEAVEALGTLGYHVVPEKYGRRHAHHVSLAHAAWPPVELHDRPESGFGARFSADDVLSRASTRLLPGGAKVRVLSPEDELVVLCVHAAGHLLERGGWLHDLRLFLDAHPRLDWPLVAARARRARARRAVAYALREVRRLGAAVPEALLAPAGGLRAGIADRLRRAALARSKRARVGLGLRLAFDVVLCDGTLAPIRRAAAHALGFARRSAYRALHGVPR